MTTPDVRAPYLVAVMGFGGFEQQALDTYIGLARSRTPAYTPCATVEDAHFVIANGDRGGVLDLLAAAQRTGDTVLVGQAPVAGVAAMLARPIDPLQLFRALDQAVKHRSLAATAARVSPRNVTMAELSTPWSNDEQQRAAAFFAPPASPLGREPGGGSARAPTAKPRGERPAHHEPPAPLRRPVPWPGSQLLPTDPSVPNRNAPGRRRSDHPDHTERAQARVREISAGSPSTGRPPGDGHIPTLDLVSNEEPELNAKAAVPLRAPPGRMTAPRTAAHALAALVIDRDSAALVPLLAAQNVQATCVDKTHHAFAMLDAFAFDAIVIDVDLGAGSELDGLEVCQAIHRQQRAPGEWCPPIVLLSAKPSALEQARGMVAGANVYLAKPVRPATLADALILAGLRPAWTLADIGDAGNMGDAGDAGDVGDALARDAVQAPAPHRADD